MSPPGLAATLVRARVLGEGEPEWAGGLVEGFSEFVSGRYPALVRYGVLLTGDRGLGEDLVQSALTDGRRPTRGP